MTFGEALEGLRRRMKIRRKNWPEKMHLVIERGYIWQDGRAGEARCWSVYHTDLLSDDWEYYLGD